MELTPLWEQRVRDEAERIADDLERMASEVRRLAGAKSVDRIATDVTHSVMWGMANLGLDNLASATHEVHEMRSAERGREVSE